MSSKNSFEVHGEDVHIYRTGWDSVAFATYREDYYEELTSVTWTMSKTAKSNKVYLQNGKFGSLHRYIMKKWYGEEMVDDMTAKGWVVDHMNNDGLDCRISNLEFLPKQINTAKGNYLDVSIRELRFRIALSLHKDFSTGLYQIHIGFNKPASLYDAASGKFATEEFHQLAKLKFLYNCDYRTVINDATNILSDYELYGCVKLDRLHFIDKKAEYFENIILTEEEKGKSVIERDGKYYFIIGNGIMFYSSPVDKGWVPSKNNDIISEPLSNPKT